MENARGQSSEGIEDIREAILKGMRKNANDMLQDKNDNYGILNIKNYQQKYLIGLNYQSGRNVVSILT